MEVFRRDHESQWLTSFYLRPKDGGHLPSFQPGQYLTVRIPDGAGSTTMRTYSLSGSPAWDHYRISVKREVPNHADTPEGFVSSYLHTRLGLGDTLEIRPPSGDFFLGDYSPETPILLLSGGVDFTPLLSMLHTIKVHAVTFLHGAISSEIYALRDEVHELEEENENITVHFRYSQPTREDERRTREIVRAVVLAKNEAINGLRPMVGFIDQRLAEVILKRTAGLVRDGHSNAAFLIVVLNIVGA